MKFFVTGVGGQLGHDVMNELSSRGHEGVGSDIAPSYSGIADGTPVTTMPYVQLDITDKEAVAKAIREVNPDAVVHCAAWTAVDAAEDEENRDRGFPHPLQHLRLSMRHSVPLHPDLLREWLLLLLLYL